MSRPPSRRGDLDGILLVDKPQGWTSHDVVAKLRGVTGQRRSGHTGTLDPMATGLLVLCLGKATRLVEYMTVHDKRYTGEITLGAATTTDDAEGEVIATATPPPIDGAQLAEIAARFTGAIQQRPPAFSAIKTGGRRAYAVARAGGDPGLAEREVVVHRLTLDILAPNRLSLELHCGPGTYVRSLARDIGEILGCGAHLSALRRTSVGRFLVRDAWALEEITGLADPASALLPADEGMLETQVALLDEVKASRFIAGGSIGTASGGPGREVLRVYSGDGEFVGTATLLPDGVLKPAKVLARQIIMSHVEPASV